MPNKSIHLGMARAVLLSSAAWLTVFGSAHGQPAAGGAPSDAVEQVVVTGTRLDISGYQQPTPVTVVSAEQMHRDVQPDLISTLAQIPSMGPVSSPYNASSSVQISAGIAGLSLANLRDLGAGRTLVLFDGVRAVQSSESGGVDLALMPTSLVQRIDVVTGGASAAWGSDAVAGVINVILNKQFTGVQVNVQGGSDERGLTRSAKAEISYGTDLFDGRGHLILSGSYLTSPDLVLVSQEPWYHGQELVNNPAYTATNGQPQLIHANNVGLAADTQGGVVISGPLKGTQFGPGGQPQPFIFGNVSNVVQTGGTFASAPANGLDDNLTIPIRSQQLFAHFSYQLADNLNANFEFNYGYSDTRNSAVTYTRNVTINIDNPYLDPSIVARMQAAGVTSFAIGTTNANNENVLAGNGPLGAGPVGNWNSDVGNTMLREVASFDGKISILGGDWNWKVDLQHSTSLRHTHIITDPLVANYNLATDPVRVTAANVGSSGLAIGTIACRSTLTAPSNGCVPLNVLGVGVADPAAIAYVNSGRALSDLTFDQFSADSLLQGQPFSTWAGPVAVALGFDYRSEGAKQTADALSYARAYSIGNFQYYDASQDDYEGFGEVDVPLLRDSFVQSLDANAAVRETNYSSSGAVTTWKFGATSQVNPDIRLRGTISRDIRAPYLTALYNPGSTTIQIVNDPVHGATNVTTLTSGNANLKPETATTHSLGLVLEPHWIPNLKASIDWYAIKITGAFATPQADIIVQNCAAGNAQYCALIRRDPTSGVITTLAVEPINSASQFVEGYDFQVDYQQPAFGGNLSASLVGNYTNENKSNVFNVITNFAGDDMNVFTGGGYPKVKATLDVTYLTDLYSGTVQFRGLSSAVLQSTYGATGVDNNNIPAQGYIDLRGSYNFTSGGNIQLYGAVDNLLDAAPPNIPLPSSAAFSYFFAPTRTDVYDFLGRVYRVGVRLKF